MESDISDIYLQLHKGFEDESNFLVSTHTIGEVMKDQRCFACPSSTKSWLASHSLAYCYIYIPYILWPSLQFPQPSDTGI